MASHDAPPASSPTPSSPSPSSSSPPAYNPGSGSATNPNTPRSDDGQDDLERIRPLPEHMHIFAAFHDTLGRADQDKAVEGGEGGGSAAGGAETNVENEALATPGQGLPKPEPEPEHEHEHDRAPSPAPSSSGGSCEQYDISPGLPQKFSVSAVDAVAYVQPDSPLQVQFGLDWVPAFRRHDTAVAFFKIRQRVRLEGLPEKHPVDRDGLAIVFLYIPPECIRRLSLDEQPSETWPRTGFTNAVALTFDMAKPPSLVFPKTIEPADALREPLAPLYMLASQPTFTIIANIPARTLPPPETKRLCSAVSACQVSSAAHLGFRTLPTLYAGHGARHLDGLQLPPAAPPPSYADASRPATSPEAPETRSRHNKRRRQDSSSPGPSSKTPGPGPTLLPGNLADVGAFLDARFRAHLQEVDVKHTAFKAEVTELLHQHKSDVLGMLEAHKAEVSTVIASSEARVTGIVLDEVQDQIKKKVTDRAGEIEASIMESITSQPLRAELTFPENPLY